MRAILRAISLGLIVFASACWDGRQARQDGSVDEADSTVFPALTGRVVDPADLLRPEQELDLNTKSEALEAQTGRQFVVVTVTSLRGQAVGTYTRDLGRHWGIGDKDRDDGVILLVAPNEKQARIAVGYGLEKTLTDALAGKIMEEVIMPKFRRGQIANGITAGADSIVQELSRPDKIVSN